MPDPEPNPAPEEELTPEELAEYRKAWRAFRRFDKEESEATEKKVAEEAAKKAAEEAGKKKPFLRIKN
jgi:hypothetical protein